MSLQRVGRLAAVALATLICLSCGQVYRPVVLPINTVPPNPANFHEVFSINANVPFNQGTAMQIDVSGDTNIGSGNMGLNPTHAAILPNNSRVFVASSGGVTCPPGADVITAFTPTGNSSTSTGFGPPNIFTLPASGTAQSASIVALSEDNAGNVTVTLSGAVSNAFVGTPIEISGVGTSGVSPYNGCFPITSVDKTQTIVQYVNSTLGLAPTAGGIATVPSYCPYLPDFVATSQPNAVFVANYGVETGLNCNHASTDSIVSITATSSVIANIAYYPGTHPVAMVETPNQQNLYVLNQGNNTVSDISPTDLTLLATPLALSSVPVWAVSRVDSQRVYVVTQGNTSVGSQLYTIRTDTNAIVSTQSIGVAGANYVLYDKSRNRLYVTNPGAGAVYVLDATTDPPTPIGSATGIVNIPAPPPCTASAGACNPVVPVSVAALPDGSRFYVASYATATGSTCPDPLLSVSGCLIPQVTSFDAATLTVKTNIFPVLAGSSSSATQGFALAPVAACVPAASYSPANPARFRMFAAAAVDSSRVYASLCDGGSVAIINTTTTTIAGGQNNAEDNLVLDLPTPFSAAAAPPGGVPPTQNPFFLLTGQ